MDDVRPVLGTDVGMAVEDDQVLGRSPLASAVAATREAVKVDDANSYLPLIGLPEPREAIADHLTGQTGRAYDPGTEVVTTSGGLSALLSGVLATIDPVDEVVVTDPTYAGLLQLVRLTGAAPRAACWGPRMSDGGLT